MHFVASSSAHALHPPAEPGQGKLLKNFQMMVMQGIIVQPNLQILQYCTATSTNIFRLANSAAAVWFRSSPSNSLALRLCTVVQQRLQQVSYFELH